MHDVPLQEVTKAIRESSGVAVKKKGIPVREWQSMKHHELRAMSLVREVKVDQQHLEELASSSSAKPLTAEEAKLRTRQKYLAM